jgi:hypothetical protein
MGGRRKRGRNGKSARGKEKIDRIWAEGGKEGRREEGATEGRRKNTLTSSRVY